MSAWDFEWGQGRSRIEASGISFAEVIEALHSEGRVEIMTTGDLSVWVIGLAGTEPRLLTVVCDRVKGTRIMEIVFARPAADVEIQIWKGRNE